MKKQILRKTAAVLFTAMTAMPGLAQSTSLVPSKPYSGKTYDYFCTWNIQGFVANYVNASGTGSPYIRAMMVEDNIFGGNNVYPNNTNTLGDHLYDKYKNWADFFPTLHKDLILVLDDSWDIPKGMNGRKGNDVANYGGMAPYGTDILDTSRFPSFNKGNATANMKALVDKVKGEGYGWKGLGLWVACQDEEDYWKARLKELGDAGVDYLKVDWDVPNKQERDINYRKNLTDWGLSIAPNLTLEHATFQGLPGSIPEVIKNSEVVRTYDVNNNKAVAETIDRVAELLRGNFKPYKEGWGIINCEDEPYIAAGLGCAIGIMRHPLAGKLPNGNDDTYFAEFSNGKGRNLKHRLNEVVRAIHWHRIAQPFGIGGEYHLSLNADGSTAGMTERSYLSGNKQEKFTYNRVSRGIDLPLYTDGDDGAAISFNDDGTTQEASFGDRPFILASHYPSGATAVAAVNRYKGSSIDNTKYYKVGINVTVEPPTYKEPVGIFGYFNNLTLKFKNGLPTGNIKVYAQDLADDKNAPTDITNDVTLNPADGSLVIKGTKINDLCKDNKYPYSEVRNRDGLQNDDYSDFSDPAIVLQVVGDGTLEVEGDKLEAETAEQYNRGDKAKYEKSQNVQTGDDNQCSGGKYVKWLAYGNQINFNYNASAKGTYALNIYYLSNGQRTLDVYVNGKMTQLTAAQLPASANLTTGVPSKFTKDVTLVKGQNTISLGNLTGEAPNIDCISLQAKDVVDEPTTPAKSYYIRNKGQNKYIITDSTAKKYDTPGLVDESQKTAEIFNKADNGTYTICDNAFAPNGWGIQGRNTIYESNNGSQKTGSWGTTLIPGFKLVDTGDGDNSYYIEYTWGTWTKGSINLDNPSNQTYIVTYGKYDQSTANWTKSQDEVANPLVFGAHKENLSNYGDDAKWYLEPADGYSDLTTFNDKGEVSPTYEQVTLSSSEATYSSNKALDFSNVEGLKAYIAKGVNDNNIVTMEEVDAVPANTGVYLKGEAGKTYEVPVATEYSAPVGNLLQPAVDYTRVYPTNDAAPHAYDGVDESLYNLMLQYSAEKGYYFIRFTYPLTFGQHRAYLQLAKSYFNDAASAAKPFTLSFGDAPTAIRTINATGNTSDAANAPVYDLQGRRVTGTLQHGIYINGGKKFVVK